MNRKLFLLTLCFVIVLVSMLFALDAVPRTINGTQEQVKSSVKDIETIETRVPYRPGGRQQVLFVEDPAGLGPPSPDQYWQAVMDSTLGVGNYGWFGPTTTQSEDGPDLTTMQTYELVIWNTYDCWDLVLGAALTATDQTNVADYLSGGGKVWLIGQDILWTGVPMAWMTTNFNLQSAIQDYNPASGAIPYPVTGLAEITGLTFSFLVDWGSDVFADGLTPTANAHHVIQDVNNPTYYPSILSNDSSTSFWTVDGRNPNPWADWEQMVYNMFDAFGVLVGVEEKPGKTIDLVFGLLQNTPNPFRDGKAAISYTTTCSGPVGLKIYDSSGRLIMTLLDRPNENAGSKTVYWDGRDNNNHPVATGVYFYRLTAKNRTATKKMVVVR